MIKLNTTFRDKATSALAGFHYHVQIGIWKCNSFRREGNWGVPRNIIVARWRVSNNKLNPQTQLPQQQSRLTSPTTNLWQYEWITIFCQLLEKMTKIKLHARIGWLRIWKIEMKYHGWAKKRKKFNLYILWCTTRFSEEHGLVAYLFKKSLLIKPL